MSKGYFRPSKGYQHQRDVTLYTRSRAGIGWEPQRSSHRGTDECPCGHVRRVHGSRPGLQLPDDRCRACDCAGFGAAVTS